MAALGYFLNPLVTVGVGVVILREPLRRLQWVAVGIGFLAAAYLIIDHGRPPWISLAVAFTFAFYGLTRKRIGATLDAIHSLTAETAVLLPVALVIGYVLASRDAATFLAHGPGHTVLLLAAGVLTAVPMLLFGAAARRIPLSHLGLMQFVTPCRSCCAECCWWAITCRRVGGSASAPSGSPSPCCLIDTSHRNRPTQLPRKKNPTMRQTQSTETRSHVTTGRSEQ